VAGGHDVSHGSREFTVHHGPSLTLRLLSVLGLGKVPVSILMTCLMVIFGATGLIANGLFSHVLPWSWGPTVYFWPSLGSALLVSFTLTGTVAKGLSRIMPTTETYASGPEDLIGSVGIAVFPLRVGHKGVVNARDPGGTVQRIAAVPMDGDVPKGAEVIIVRHHREGDYYDVSASPL